MKKTKQVWLNHKKTKYCIIHLFGTNSEMQKAYDKNPHNNGGSKVLGAHCGYEKYKTPNYKIHPETGIVFLSLENCGASVVPHELMHAVLWAWKHKRLKKQYPIVIKNMKDEEELLHNQSFAVNQFYNWYWKITKKGKFTNTKRK